jgi:N-methylhydantoinase A
VAGLRVGVDVGGTFTDLVVLADGAVETAKVPSTPADQSAGVVNALRAAGVDLGAVAALAHGTTVATNALLERRGARTALVTTEGFRDVLEIARQKRPSLYDLTEDRPPALVPRELRFAVRERMGREGVVQPLDDASVREAVAAVRGADVDAVAVCLLFAFLHPEHERRVGEALRAALPDVHVSLSSEVLPEFREYERFATTTADAYLGPRVAAYLGRLAARVGEAGGPPPLVMQSSGGVVAVDEAATGAGRCVLSGPAGGVVGAAHMAAASGYADVLTLDMGGTSTDVAPVVAGEVATTTEAVVAGVPVRFPTVDVHTVSAGGGSLAWVDEGGALRVGPRSAGADPGPVCYGKGGEEATVTDADLLLGYLEDGAELGGEIVLRTELAERALERVGRRLGMDPVEAARGVVEVANAEMVRALRVISVERGLDPRDFALVAFGGAGPMHACALAEELGMRTVLVPRASGVLSALGLAISDLRRDYVRPVLGGPRSAEGGGLDEPFAELEARACADLAGAALRRGADLRYRGQAFELTVDGDDVGELRERFHAAHERRYGYRMDDEPVEVVNVRMTATAAGEKPELVERPAPGRSRPLRRRASFDGGWAEPPVFDRRALGAGSEVEGPAIVAFPDSTCVVRPAWRGVIDEIGTLVLRAS